MVCFTALIQDFKNTYLESRSMTIQRGLQQLTVTPTVHVILVHIHQFFQRHGTARGLGWYSEQATETSHNDWLQLWEKGYKVPDTHPLYPGNLKGANAKYNTNHN